MHPPSPGRVCVGTLFPACLVLSPCVVAPPPNCVRFCPGALACGRSCFAHVRPCAQGRCGRCPPGSGVMSDLFFFFLSKAIPVSICFKLIYSMVYIRSPAYISYSCIDRWRYTRACCTYKRVTCTANCKQGHGDITVATIPGQLWQGNAWACSWKSRSTRHNRADSINILATRSRLRCYVHVPATCRH